MKQIASTSSRVWTEIELIESKDLNEFNLIITNERGREFDGFGCCFNELGFDALLILDEEKQSDILNDLFSSEGDCKFNFGRIPIGANDYSLNWYSYNETENDFDMKKFNIERDNKLIIPYVREALKRNPDLQIISSPWSPPTWMKTHKVYNYGKLIWEDRYLKSYAKYLMKFAQEYKKKDIKISQIHIQNEVTANQKFPSCKWSGTELRDFIKFYLGPLFDKYSIDTEIWLGTINSPELNQTQQMYEDYDLYAGLVLRDSSACGYITGVGYQWAGRNALQQTVDAYPEKKYLQTENECGDGKNSWEYAEYIFSLIRFYLVNGVNGYLYWNAVLPVGGESTWGWKQNSMISIDTDSRKIIYNPEYYVMKHFSHFIKKGSRRLIIKGHESSIGVAFENEDGSIVIIICNKTNEEIVLNIKIKNSKYKAILEGHSFNTFFYN